MLLLHNVTKFRSACSRSLMVHPSFHVAGGACPELPWSMGAKASNKCKGVCAKLRYRSDAASVQSTHHLEISARAHATFHSLAAKRNPFYCSLPYIQSK